MLQQTLSTSNQSEDLSVHEIDMGKGMDEFSGRTDSWPNRWPLQTGHGTSLERNIIGRRRVLSAWSSGQRKQ